MSILTLIGTFVHDMAHLQIVDGGDIVLQHMPSRLNHELNFILLLNCKLILSFEVFTTIIQVMFLWV
jgi:hypothetical protein